MGSTVSKVDKGEGRVSELADRSVALPKWKDNEKENGEKRNRISKSCDTITKGNYNMQNGSTRWRIEKGTGDQQLKMTAINMIRILLKK